MPTMQSRKEEENDELIAVYNEIFKECRAQKYVKFMDYI